METRFDELLSLSSTQVLGSVKGKVDLSHCLMGHSELGSMAGVKRCCLVDVSYEGRFYLSLSEHQEDVLRKER